MNRIKPTRLISLAIVLISLVLIATGFALRPDQPILGDRLIGTGTVGIFLLAMPLFLFTESRGKNLRDYMLTRENLERMKERERNRRH